MNMRGRIVASLAVLATAGDARADHHGMAMDSGEAEHSSLSANVSVLAASFSPSQSEDMFYGGNYQGVIAGGTWTVGPFSSGASWSYYRLLRNGAEAYGKGDLVLHGQAAWLTRPEAQAGVMLAASVPTGSEMAGFGMGHAMLMPATYAAWRVGPTVLAASFGYSRALSTGDHVHGMAPLVEPMNMSELSWSASGDVAVGAGVRAGARASGGIPVGSLQGTERVIAALRVAWGSGRVDTAAELQAGLVGDPFNLRAVVSTALRF